MSETNQFLINHGMLIIFGVVFVEQMGAPIPGLLWLMAAGALAAEGKFHWLMGLELSVLACLLADCFWFYLGKHRGTQVLGLLCRLSLEPDSCVSRTVNVFTRYGWRGIVVSKFVPGMSTLTPPLAGMSGFSPQRFLLFDGISSFLYCGLFLLLGYLFSNQITQIGAAFAQIGGGTLRVIVVLLAFYIAYKYWLRQRLLKELRMAKITPDELRQMLDSNQKPFILDMRSIMELERDPSMILGATHLALDEVEKRHGEFPQDQEIITYCSCPNEITSAKTALRLRKRGFKRVRPLLGGIDAWRKGDHPMSTWTKVTPNAASK